MCSLPERVPTARMVPFCTQATELTVSPTLERSHSLATAALWAVQRYTQAPRPTPRMFVVLQSTRLR